MAGKDDYLIDQLIDVGYLNRAQVEALKPEAEAAGKGVVELLLERNLISAAEVTQAKAGHFGYEVVNVGELKLTDDIISAIPRHSAKRYRCIPVSKHGNSLGVVLADPSDLDTLDSLGHLLRAELEFKVSSPACA